MATPPDGMAAGGGVVQVQAYTQVIELAIAE